MDTTKSHSFAARLKQIPGPAASLSHQLNIPESTKTKKSIRNYINFQDLNVWKEACKQVNLDPKESIAEMKAQTELSNFPHLLVFLQELVVDSDASALFSDPSGEIKGTIHHKVFDVFPDVIAVGCVLELIQVSVFRPSKYARYLNVVPNMIKAVYPGKGRQPIFNSLALAEHTADGVEKADIPKIDGRAKPTAPTSDKSMKPIKESMIPTPKELDLGKSLKRPPEDDPDSVKKQKQTEQATLIEEMFGDIDESMFDEDII